MKIKLDDYQKEVLKAKGNICLCSGRQVGKSTIISIKAGEFAIKNPKKSILIISATERQAEELFIKVLYYLDDNYRTFLMGGKERPTKRMIRLKNGSIIRCLPTGLSGLGIRGFTIDMLIADEAAFIPDEVWSAVTPMLLTTGGDIILVSTPFGKRGYFYDCYNDESFTTFHVNSEQVVTERQLSAGWLKVQKEKALEHLEREKRKMSQLQYAQEYLGQFVDELRQFFTDKLIAKCCVGKRQENNITKGRTYFLGVDVAGMGEDESTFEIIDRTNREMLKQVENIIMKKSYTTEISQRIMDLHNKYKFKKIYVDDGGIGFGVFSELLHATETKSRVIAINNSARSLDKKDKNRKRIIKEDLYNNLLVLMEQGKIQFLNDDEVIRSLKSVQYEYLRRENESTRFRIFGSYTHITEGLIRAAWCHQDKTLNIWASSLRDGI